MPYLQQNCVRFISNYISSQSSLNFFCSHFRFFCAAVFLKPFPCSYFIAVIPGNISVAISVFFCSHIPETISLQLFHRSHPWNFFCSHVSFFCSRIPETISLQLFHRSHPWNFFCSHFRFFFCSHIPETISLQLFHRSHPWIFFCSHVFFFCSCIPETISLQISSQSSLDFFCSHVFFFAAVFLKPFPCRFHRSHPWNFFCSHFYSISTPIFGQLYSKFKSLLGPFLEPFTCSFFIAAISHFGRAAIFLSVCLYTKRVPKYIICFSRFFLGEHLGAFRSWLLSTDTSCSLLRRRASSATGRSKMQKTCLRRTRNRRSQRKLRRGRLKPPRSDPR